MSVVRSFAVVALLVVAPALAACSGADDQDVLAPSAGSDTSSTEPAPAAASGPSASSAPSGSAGGTDGTAPGTDPAAPPAKGQPAPDQPAAPACTPEVEPNNDFAHASPFTDSVCGKIGSAADIDDVSFVVPNDADVVRVQHTEMNGRAAYRYFRDGAAVTLDNGELEVVPGATYVIQVRLDKSNGGSGSLPSYEIDVAFH